MVCLPMSGYGGASNGQFTANRWRPLTILWRFLPKLSPMRRSRTARPIGDILGELIRSMGIEGPLARGHVVATWEGILSDQMKQQVEKCWVRSDKLYVRVSNAAWRQELHLRREEWRQRLNTELGGEMIKEIVFR